MRARFFLILFFLISGLSYSSPLFSETDGTAEEDYKILHEIIINEFKAETPAQSGIELAGVLKHFETKERQTAIVLEACSATGADLDIELLKKMNESAIPASLFVDQAWLKKNGDKLKPFVVDGHLLVENHGLSCRPLSVSGQGPADHPGTKTTDEAFEEIEKNARLIESYSGRLPRFFKSGYDFYDDVALKIVNVLGYSAIRGNLRLRSKDVASDSALKDFVARIESGSIVVIPANRPGTSQDWLPKLLAGMRQKGYQVVPLDNVAGVKDEDL